MSPERRSFVLKREDGGLGVGDVEVWVALVIYFSLRRRSGDNDPGQAAGGRETTPEVSLHVISGPRVHQVDGYHQTLFYVYLGSYWAEFDPHPPFVSS